MLSSRPGRLTQYWPRAVVKPGRMMFELEGVTPEIAEKAMALASAKLGVRTKFVVREGAHTDAS